MIRRLGLCALLLIPALSLRADDLSLRAARLAGLREDPAVREAVDLLLKSDFFLDLDSHGPSAGRPPTPAVDPRQDGAWTWAEMVREDLFRQAKSYLSFHEFEDQDVEYHLARIRWTPGNQFAWLDVEYRFPGESHDCRVVRIDVPLREIIDITTDCR